MPKAVHQTQTIYEELMMNLRLVRKLALMPVIAVCSLAVMTSAAFAQFEPKKPVEFIIMAGTGGGADQMARLMQSIIQKNNFSSQPFIPIN